MTESAAFAVASQNAIGRGKRNDRAQLADLGCLECLQKAKFEAREKLGYDALLKTHLGGNVIAKGVEDLHNLGLVSKGETDVELTNAGYKVTKLG